MTLLSLLFVYLLISFTFIIPKVLQSSLYSFFLISLKRASLTLFISCIPKSGQGVISMNLSIISLEERKALIKNQYVYNVTEYCIIFTEEGKDIMYSKLLEGKSIIKIFDEMGIPFTDHILPKFRYFGKELKKEYARKGSFKRHYSFAPINDGLDGIRNKKIDELEKKLLLKEQELSFLKKITEAAK